MSGHVHGGEKADVAKIIAAMDKNKDGKYSANVVLL